jgi:hypothetical protein
MPKFKCQIEVKGEMTNRLGLGLKMQCGIWISTSGPKSVPVANRDCCQGSQSTTMRGVGL